MTGRIALSGVRRSALASAVVVFSLALVFPTAATAQGGGTEIGFTIGALLGDDVDIGLGIIDDVQARFDNASIFGGRLGWYGFPLGAELSVLYSPNSFSTEPDILATDVKILYLEGNALLIILPGPIGPFVSGGIGLHRFDFQVGDVDMSQNSFGWNWGGGLKLNLGPIVVRGDLRDHVTKLDSGIVAALLGVSNTFHNWEASGTIGVRF